MTSRSSADLLGDELRAVVLILDMDTVHLFNTGIRIDGVFGVAVKYI